MIVISKFHLRLEGDEPVALTLELTASPSTFFSCFSRTSDVKTLVQSIERVLNNDLFNTYGSYTPPEMAEKVRRRKIQL